MNKKIFWIYALSSSVYFTQGIEGLPSQGLFYYFKETLHFSPQKIMIIGSIITLAWMIKPLIGFVIDNFLSKKTWIYVSLILDVMIILVLGLAQLPVILLVGFMLLNSTNAAFRDVGVDGIMCVEGKKYGLTGKIQSVQWVSISVAGLIIGVAGGYIAQISGYKLGFLCLLPFYFIMAVMAHGYKEEPNSKNEHSSNSLLGDLKKLFADKRLMVVCLFIFLYKYSPSFGTPLMFIQRDSFKWSKLWIGSLGTIGTIFQICGALVYYKFSQKINVRKWLYLSVFLGALTTLSYLYYTPITAILYDILYGFIGMFIFIMIMDVMAQNTLTGLEATSFALLCSVNNLAQSAGDFSGALLLPVVGLKWLIVLSALTSFLCLPLIKRIQ